MQVDYWQVCVYCWIGHKIGFAEATNFNHVQKVYTHTHIYIYISIIETFGLSCGSPCKVGLLAGG